VPSSSPLERTLAVLRRDGGPPLALSALAARLLALEAEPPVDVARRIVAAALGADPTTLPDPFSGPRAACLLEPATAPPEWLLTMPLEAADLFVVDLETTGSAGAGSTILEIGAVRISGGCVVERYQTLVNPLQPIPLSIQVLTGIRDGMVAGAPTLGPAMRAFSEWLDRVPGAPFVAHNAPFDEGFVRRALALCGLPPLARPVLCTRRLSRRLVPEMSRHGLDALCARFEIENRARHRALGDAEATAELLLLLLRRAREQAGLATLGELLALHGRSVRAARREIERARAAPPAEGGPDAV
jgi:DNA polymerase III epsilon subunit family exonuclease